MMHIKSRLRNILGDLLFKLPVKNYRDRLTNKQTIKNIILDQGEERRIVSSNKACFLRILATNQENAYQIQSLLAKHKDELDIDSIHIASKAIDYAQSSPRRVESPLFEKSIIIKFNPKLLLHSIINQDANHIREEVLESDYIDKQKERIVIDFSSPNIAKPFHFGHLKSTILGNYLANLNKFLGNEVTKLNYIGDWGTQYGLLSLGLEEYKNSDKELMKSTTPLRYLLDVYVRANERGRTDETFYIEAKRIFLEIDSQGKGSKQYNKWNEIRDLSLEELKSSYARLGIHFDKFEYESDYARSSIELVDEMMKKNIANKLEDGVVVANVTKNNRHLEVPVLKADGTSLYLTRDVAAAIKRKEKFNYDKMLYVVGADQEKHFHCLGEILKNLDYGWPNDNLIHVKMGKVLGMSSRSGKVELLSDIIDEATKQFVESTKNTQTSRVNLADDVENVGKHLALSALFVYDMKNPRTKHYEFNWYLVMLRNSRSGINLQTTLARLSSLLDKANQAGIYPITVLDELDPKAVACEEAINLMLQLEEIDTNLHSSYWSMDPCPLVQHAILLCKLINKARRSDDLWVLGEPDERKARTRLSMFKSSFEQLEMIIKLIGLKPLYKV